MCRSPASSTATCDCRRRGRTGTHAGSSAPLLSCGLRRSHCGAMGARRRRSISERVTRSRLALRCATLCYAGLCEKRGGGGDIRYVLPTDSSPANPDRFGKVKEKPSDKDKKTDKAAAAEKDKNVREARRASCCCVAHRGVRVGLRSGGGGVSCGALRCATGGNAALGVRTAWVDSLVGSAAHEWSIGAAAAAHHGWAHTSGTQPAGSQHALFRTHSKQCDVVAEPRLSVCRCTN